MADEKKIAGIPHSHFDGYDGGAEPPEDFIAGLMKDAPPAIKARAAEFAKEHEVVKKDK